MIDGVTNTVIKTIEVGDVTNTGIGNMAINPARERLYGIDNKLPANVVVVDTATDSLLTTIPTVGGAGPGIAVNSVSNRIYVGYMLTRELAVIDGNTNTVIQTVDLGNKRPNEVAVNSTTNHIYVSFATFDGTYDVPPYGLLVLDGTSLSVIKTLPMVSAANRISVNETTRQVYLSVTEPDSFNGHVIQLDGYTNTVVVDVPLPDALNSIAVNSYNDHIYLPAVNSDVNSGRVYILDALTLTIVDVKPIGTAVYDVTFDPVTSLVYAVALDDVEAIAVQQLSRSLAAGSSGNTIAVFQDSLPRPVGPKRNVYDTHTPTLTWGPITWAAGYRLEVDNNNSFSSPEFVYDDAHNPTAFALTDYLNNGRYFWRVQAKRANGQPGAWSAVDSFSIAAP
ncbi:MAG: hypothetical protein HZC41_26725 [Chloroflexi bacterium]|nr:hypothetical protein [Chloroflexota bacterium]